MSRFAVKQVPKVSAPTRAGRNSRNRERRGPASDAGATEKRVCYNENVCTHTRKPGVPPAFKIRLYLQLLRLDSTEEWGGRQGLLSWKAALSSCSGKTAG
ncbi:hypothetical protein DIPPA_60622, partial [Diplonema papillatum]